MITSTRFTDLVGCGLPLQLAAMGGVGTTELAAAVVSAGGLGMVPGSESPTPGACGLNFLVPFVTSLDVVREAARSARVVEFFYADPDSELVQIVHAGGALAAWAIGSREEALLAIEAGCDFIIAQGIEAGGHVRGTIGLLPLLGEVLDAVPVPVLAAGGIGTGRAMAAALAAGADGVRVGTRFAAAEEAGAHPRYLEALLGARAKDTVYTGAFSVGWPDAPVRVLRSSLAAAEAFPHEIVGEAINRDGSVASIPRLMAGVPDRLTSGQIDAMCWPAGESVSGLKRLQCAGEIVRELAAEAEDLLRRW